MQDGSCFNFKFLLTALPFKLFTVRSNYLLSPPPQLRSPPPHFLFSSAVNLSSVEIIRATGYIGSWLVQSLLNKGFVVHATARDIGKATNIFSSWENCDRLKIYRADLREEGSFDEAVKDCIGVFHVAASMEFGTSAIENIENYVESTILEPAISGAVNLLGSCVRAQTVKRVIFTSSISTITAKNNKGEFKRMVDESSIVSIEQVRKAKPNGWVYVLSKLMTEKKAFQFADANGIDLVSIIPPTVSGPFLTPDVPSSVRVLLSPITGDPILYPILRAVYTRLGSLPFVHIEDICNAHMHLMEEKTAKGRYICAADTCTITQLIDHFLTCKITVPSAYRFDEEFGEAVRPVISSKRLTNLGFKFKYSGKDVIRDTVSYCRGYGFL